MLRKLQRVLNKIWTLDEYSPQFKRDKCLYRDFRHTIAHLFKAVGRLNEMVEEADHTGSLDAFSHTLMCKYIADIVICAARCGITAPKGEIDVEGAVYRRMIDKMNVNIETSVIDDAESLADSIMQMYSTNGEFNNRTSPMDTQALRQLAKELFDECKKERMPV